jgi:hypothetical protein
MSIKEKPPDDFFKGIKLSLKSVLKHPDINTPKIIFFVICNVFPMRNEIIPKHIRLDTTTLMKNPNRKHSRPWTDLL